jgi:hypothetical protein
MGTTKIPPLFSKDKKLEPLIGCVLADLMGCQEILDLSLRLSKNIVSSFGLCPGQRLLGSGPMSGYFFQCVGLPKKEKKGRAGVSDGSDADVRVLVCLPFFLPANSTEEVGSRQAFLNQVRVYHLEAHRRLVHAAVPNGKHRAFNFPTSQDGAAAAVRLKLKTNRLCRRKNRSGAFSS